MSSFTVFVFFWSQVKVRDLEQRCRSQSEHFQQLSNELRNFPLHSQLVDIQKINTFSTVPIPFLLEKNLPEVIEFDSHLDTGRSVFTTF